MALSTQTQETHALAMKPLCLTYQRILVFVLGPASSSSLMPALTALLFKLTQQAKQHPRINANAFQLSLSTKIPKLVCALFQTQSSYKMLALYARLFQEKIVQA